MPYNILADSSTETNFVADFLPEKCTFTPKMATLHFSALSAAQGQCTLFILRIILKHVVDVQLLMIELFSLDVTAEVLRAKID